MRVAPVVEGCYPYAIGGVTTRCDQLVRGLAEHEFEVVALTAGAPPELVVGLPGNVRALTVLSLTELGRRPAVLAPGVVGAAAAVTGAICGVVLADLAPMLWAVVINPANGPGERVDPAYPPVLDPLRAAGVRLVGYVDTAYGRRPPGQLDADLVGYRDRYGITDVFFDQVAMGLPELDHYADVVLRARWRGARFVVLNPGTRPHPGYLDLADVVVTFEGPLFGSDPVRVRRQRSQPLGPAAGGPGS